MLYTNHLMVTPIKYLIQQDKHYEQSLLHYHLNHLLFQFMKDFK